MNRTFKIILLICVCYLAAALIFMPQLCLDAGKNAVRLCLDAVIPSLFPFFVCSGLFAALGLARLCSRTLSPLMRPLFNIPGSGALAFVLGIVSGYPMGAACAADLYRSGECTKTEAERMTAFCNNSGPLFIMGVVGCGILQNPRAGQYLYAAHVFAALLTGLIFRFYGGSDGNRVTQALPPSPQITAKGTAAAVGNVIDNAVASMLKICAFVLIFSVLAAALPVCRFTPYIYAFLEITGGVNAVSRVELDPVLKLSLISFFISLSGVSVMFQVNSVIRPCGLTILPYIAGKLISAVFSFAAAYLMFIYIPITETAFAPENVQIFSIMTPRTAFAAAAASIFAGCACLGLLVLAVRTFSRNKGC